MESERQGALGTPAVGQSKGERGGEGEEEGEEGEMLASLIAEMDTIQGRVRESVGLETHFLRRSERSLHTRGSQRNMEGGGEAGGGGEGEAGRFGSASQRWEEEEAIRKMFFR